MRHVCWFLLVLFACSAFAAQTTVSFDEFLPNPGEYIRNVSLADEAATFLNTYEESYNYWAGFAFSTVSNTTDGPGKPVRRRGGAHQRLCGGI